MTRKPTSTDVAKLAQVSRSAVSLVLSGRASAARLSPDTAERVMKAAEALHYRPNASGRSLVRGKTDTVGLIVRDLNLLDVDPVLSLLLSGILQRCREGGYQVLVETARSDGDGDPFGELMDSGRIDGMIVENPDFGDKSLSRLIQSNQPVVVMGSQGLEEEVSVSIDDFQIGLVATEHLASLGRRRVAHIAYAESGIYAVDKRFAGYQAALSKAGLSMDPALVTHANFSMESGYHAMVRLLSSRSMPDAVFATSDAVAMGAIAAIQDAGHRVPQEIAVASVDDISAARFFRPALTTVTSEPYACGKLAAEMLIDLMSGRMPPKRSVMVDTRLIIRGSTMENYSDRLLKMAPNIVSQA